MPSGLFLISVLALLAAPHQASVADAARLSGVVVDANGGELLARVRIRLDDAGRETETNDVGEFAFDGVPAGEHVLLAETVGYRRHRSTVTTSLGQPTTVTLPLTADAMRLTETVTVTVDPFVSEVPESPSQMGIGATEIRNLSSVLLDDPMRSLSTLPGVSAPDDYHAEFSVRGAPFSRVGVYLDEVPLRAPTHTFGGVAEGYSISALNDQVLQSISLLSVAPPTPFGGTIGAAVVADTRDGSREKTAFHASIGISDINLLGEGPLASDKRGSWFVALRRSHLAYVVDRLGGSSDEKVTFTDIQGKITYDLSPKHTVSVHALAGDSHYDAGLPDVGAPAGSPGVVLLTPDVGGSAGSTDLIKANWRYTPSPSLLISTTAAYQRAHDELQSRTQDLLSSSRYADVSGRSSVSWFWAPTSPLRVGYEVHRASDAGISSVSLFEDPAFRAANAYDGRAVSQNAYAEQQWASRSGRAHLTAGLRWQTNSQVHAHPVLPFVSSSFTLTPATHVEFGWGQYAQFPEFDMEALAQGNTGLAPERSTHYVAAIERRLDSQTRVRVEAYDREDSDILDAPDVYPRLQGGSVTWPAAVPRWTNAYDGYERGVEVVLQRRSASRLTGWAGYTLGYNRQRDLATNIWFDSDGDIRHGLTLYAGYRLRPSLNLSARFNHTSGAPVSGYFVVSDFTTMASRVVDVRNTSRFPSYERLDLRVNKSFVRDRWKMTLYAEAMNTTDHRNLRDLGFAGNFRNQASTRFDTTVPRLPSVGLSVDF